MYGSKQKEYIALFIQCQLPAHYTMRNENEKSFSVEGRMEIVFSLSPYLLKQIFNAVPLIKPLIICRFR
ncbi:hypothetical protein DWV30_13195 [Bacteroides ovatus]|uniref:Uncharacterized protein n=2 Tax=Bacteroides ovatus TaxID=28116 RepID=A0A413EP45_BACOV|nr:hypothetical protein DWZ47_24080 [Bacteroides sp. AF32-8BH]RGX09107.1 hypothetical protein DWV35_14195 [Bacteroides ovatus]RGX22629.1 hypothetical protein DWV30_13195 [Bacteroides ovatus]